MTKIARAITKFLLIIIFLLVLVTIGIFIYPKFADKTQIDDKVVSFIANRVPGPAEGEEVGGTEVGISENSTVSEWIPPQKEVEVNLKDDSRTQTWTDEEKQALKKAYNIVLNKMGYQTDNLLFYEMKNLDGDTYYTFQVLDDFGNAYEDILLYDPDNSNVFWHDKNGRLTHAFSTDSIFSGEVEGNVDVAYEDDTWRKVMEGYLNAILTERNADKASTYLDSSCYYLAKLSELRREDFIDATIENQAFLIEETEKVEERKNSKNIDSYKWSYDNYDKEEYIDEYNMDWVEAHIVVDLDISSDGEDEHFRDYYCVHLREYEYGWRVAAFTKE